MEIELATIRDIAATVGAVSAAIGISWAAFMTARKLPGMIWDWLSARVDERRSAARRERALHELIGLLPEIRAELKPNHGSSLRDQVDNTHRLAADQAAALRAHTEASDHVHEGIIRGQDAITVRLESIEERLEMGAM